MVVALAAVEAGAAAGKRPIFFIEGPIRNQLRSRLNGKLSYISELLFTINFPPNSALNTVGDIHAIPVHGYSPMKLMNNTHVTCHRIYCSRTILFLVVVEKP
jgi:hypothetical protein